MSEVSKRDAGKTIQEKANVLWDVANSLAGLYKPHEYGLVILPMAVVKRFHDCLLPTYAKVQKEYAAKKHLQVRDAFLCAASGYNFYNTSRFTFETLLADPKNIGANFRDYLNGFSDNVRDVLEQMKFEDQIDTMEKGGVLYQVISDFNSAKADMLIRGGNPDNMRYGNTLSDDKFQGFKFDYVISNPPFGIDWKVEAKAVEAEAAKGDEGRFGVGLPSKSDGQMLFMLNGIAKLKDDGRMAIIQNGSSLFSGDAGSGPSEIRRHIIENDWLEAIIQLPNDSFYNTGIATYVWVITKAKPRERKGKVQLIDASKCCEARRKSIGNKRVDIAENCRKAIIKAYRDFETRSYRFSNGTGSAGLEVKSHIFTNSAFGYTKIVVETPLVEDGKKVLKKGKPVADTAKRDTESVPLGEDIEAYMKREVLPYNPEAWVDYAKSKVGYEIPFTRTFYEYKPIEKADDVAQRIKAHEARLAGLLGELFGKGAK